MEIPPENDVTMGRPLFMNIMQIPLKIKIMIEKSPMFYTIMVVSPNVNIISISVRAEKRLNVKTMMEKPQRLT
jgi:hypothetical protein